MRTHFWIISVILAASSWTSGCQYIAGVADLEATENGGGGGPGGSKQNNGTTCTENAQCISNFCTDGICCSVASCAPYACNATGEGCTQTCTEMSGCAKTGFCDQPNGQQNGVCELCGWKPNPSGCNAGSCENCAGNTCTKTCDSPNECSSNRILDGAVAQVNKLVCNDQCNNITIKCSGASPCEIVCEEGGCQNVVVDCDRIGQCSLTCHGKSCAGASMLCGGNSCTATCDQAVDVSQDCDRSCSCTKPGCM